MHITRQVLGTWPYLMILFLLSACVNTGTNSGPHTVSPVPPARTTLVLPPDADRTSLDRQTHFLERGMYLTQNGQVLALPANYDKTTWDPRIETPGDAKAPSQSRERIVIDLSRPTP